jgi:hypothetical protein
MREVRGAVVSWLQLERQASRERMFREPGPGRIASGVDSDERIRPLFRAGELA